VSFVGSKGQAGVFHRIIGQMPPHSVYVEPFFGRGQIFWEKRPARESILIEREPGFLATASAVPGVHTICGDALEILPTLALPADAVVYCDPPYLLSTRQGRRYYAFELSDQDHLDLLGTLRALSCRVLLSGYPSALYDEGLPGWRVIRYRVRTRRRSATECLWANFPEPEELHDWRFAGANYRQRLSLKRLAGRWLARLDGMPPRKRGYVWHALQQRQGERGGPGAPEVAMRDLAKNLPLTAVLGILAPGPALSDRATSALASGAGGGLPGFDCEY
jgi:hypothetical protein